MEEKSKKENLSEQQRDSKSKQKLQGYPLYPQDEDIYKKYKEEKDVDPEDTTKTKEPILKDKMKSKNEKDFDDDVSGSDLDVPGSELDDNLENIGSEDEENNYYSLGGDDHDDLDEDKGE